MSIFKFKVININGEEESLEKYQGKIILIVNTASACGFTPQYGELEELQNQFKDDLVILAFPCNQFGAQEPGSDQEIKKFCDLKFNISFPLFSKVDVNGKEEDALFTYLKSSTPGILGSQKIKWNFTKFLVDKNGLPVKRYAPIKKPMSLIKDIKRLL